MNFRFTLNSVEEKADWNQIQTLAHVLRASIHKYFLSNGRSAHVTSCQSLSALQTRSVAAQENYRLVPFHTNAAKKSIFKVLNFCLQRVDQFLRFRNGRFRRENFSVDDDFAFETFFHSFGTVRADDLVAARFKDDPWQTFATNATFSRTGRARTAAWCGCWCSWSRRRRRRVGRIGCSWLSTLFSRHELLYRVEEEGFCHRVKNVVKRSVRSPVFDR